MFVVLPGHGQRVAPTEDSGEDVFAVGVYDQGDFRATPSRTFDLLHTSLELSFDWDKQWVYGTATLRLRPYFYDQQWLTLHAKGMQINSIRLGGSAGQELSRLTYEYDGTELNIDLGQPLTRNDSIEVVIEYIGKPNEYSDNKNGILADDQGLYFINPSGSKPNMPRQIWTQGETAFNSVWFPTIDHPNERCTQEVIITVDSTLKTLSNGVLTSSSHGDDGLRTDHWVLDKPHAPYLFMLIIGDYTVVDDDHPDIPISYWVEPAYGAHAKSIFGHTPEMIEFFSQLFDYPYPWGSYSQVVVRDFVSGAMENTTASVFMEEVQVDQRTLLDYNWDYIIAHELAHQWFGNLVTCESWSYLPLNEAFANYAEYLWNEYKYGDDEASYHLQEELYTYLAETEEQKLELVRYYYEDAEDMFDAHSYSKGGRVLHMLRNYVGDEAFFAALHTYLSENAFKSVEVDHLRLALEKVTGEDLNWFFDQWFFNPGHPQVEIQHNYANDTLRLELIQLQDLTISPIYRLPFYVDIHFEGGVVRYPVTMENMQEEYAFAVDEEPKLIVVDPSFSMLWEVYHPKTQEEYAYQFVNGDNSLLRKEALDSIMSLGSLGLKEEALEMALNDEYHRLRGDALDYYLDYPEMIEGGSLEQVMSMIDDSLSSIRASALMLLSSIDYAGVSTNVLEGLQDSSYSVVGSALASLYENDLETFEHHLRQFEDYTNINVVIPIAQYYSERASTEATSYFLSLMDRIGRNDLYYLLQYVSTYILICSNEDQRELAPPLTVLANTHQNYTVRFAALQSLFLMVDLPEIPNEIKRIINEEKDPRLLEIYSTIQGDLD